jgi:hypothetical protein
MIKHNKMAGFQTDEIVGKNPVDFGWEVNR